MTTTTRTAATANEWAVALKALGTNKSRVIWIPLTVQATDGIFTLTTGCGDSTGYLTSIAVELPAPEGTADHEPLAFKLKDVSSALSATATTRKEKASPLAITFGDEGLSMTNEDTTITIAPEKAEPDVVAGLAKVSVGRPLETVTMTAADLRDMVANAKDFLGTDDSLPYLKMVHIAPGDGGVWAYATDQYIMLRTYIAGATHQYMKSGQTLDVDIVALTAATHALKNQPDDTPVTITHHPARNMSAIRWNGGVVSTPEFKTDGNDKRLANLVPESFTHSITCDREHLATQLTKLKKMAYRKFATIVRIVPDGERLFLEMAGSDADARVYVDARHDLTRELRIHLKRLMTAVTAPALAEQVRICANNAENSLVTLVSADTSALRQASTAVVMTQAR